jgi:hypothetical protein
MVCVDGVFLQVISRFYMMLHMFLFYVEGVLPMFRLNKKHVIKSQSYKITKNVSNIKMVCVQL